MSKQRADAGITLDRIQIDLFLGDMEGLADAVMLCGEGAERLGLSGNDLAFTALQTAIKDRVAFFRRKCGLPVERDKLDAQGEAA